MGVPNCGCEEGYMEDSEFNCIVDDRCKKEPGRKSYGDCACLRGYYENIEESC